MLSAVEVLSQPIKLGASVTLPNRLVKCPMQETLAEAPYFDPPMAKFRALYGRWGTAKFGLIITGQVQVDIRFLSVEGDVVVRKESLTDPKVLALWKEWANIAQAAGTPCIVQLAHPGRMSPIGAGMRPREMQTLCPSAVPVDLGDNWLDKKAVEALLGIPRACTLDDIDQVVDAFLTGAKVSQAAGFAGIQLHAAHGFLLSQFLSPHTNRRTDEYGGSPAGRLFLLQRLVREVREACPLPFCLSVKLNSGDYMAKGGLTQEEALEQVKWLVTCGLVDMVEISGGNAEGSQGSSKLHESFDKKTISKAPKIRESTRIRESFFTEFADKVKELHSPIPIQLSGGFRSRTGMADAVLAGTCDLIGLGRAVVIQPSLPSDVLLNPDLPDEEAFAVSHQVRGLWLAKLIPVKVVGLGLPVHFFYYNMKLLGAGLPSDLHASLPFIAAQGGLRMLTTKLRSSLGRFYSYLPVIRGSNSEIRAELPEVLHTSVI